MPPAEPRGPYAQNRQQGDGTAVASLLQRDQNSDCMFIFELPKDLSPWCIPIWPLLLSSAGAAQPKVPS